MKELLNEVKQAMESELIRANKEFPLFRSNHEGAFVILEEITEATQDVKRVFDRYRVLAKSVFHDNDSAAEHSARKLRESALYAACEYIQVAAMAEKFTMKEEEFSQEHADYLAEICAEAKDDDLFAEYKKLKNLFAKMRKETGNAE